MAAVQVELYRKANADGTSKDWAAPVVLNRQRLTVFYGRTGSVLRQAETPASRCRDGSPVREAQARVREKLGKGYQALGVHLLADNRRDLTPEQRPAALAPAAPATTQTLPPALYWRLRLSDPQAGQVFEAAVQETTALLATVGWTLPGSQPDADGRELWLRIIGRPVDASLVLLTDENRPRVAFFLVLARRNVGLSLADESGQVITTWPEQLPIEAAVLEALGLRLKDLNQWLAASSGDVWFF